MYGNMKPQRGKVANSAKKNAPRRPAPKPPTKATDPVEVYCRIRPLDDPEHPVCCKVLGPDTLLLTATENSHAAKTGGIIKETKYTFQQVFDEFAPQKAVFDQVALPLVEDVLHGKNALLFAYGVTSSGKTHTMTGEPQDPGMLPRCLDMIFNSIQKLQCKKYVFKPDKMNGFDVQTEADAMLERQRRELMPKLSNMNTPKTPGPKDNNEFDFGKRQKDRSRLDDLDEDTVYAVFISYVEIYNKYIYDLLEEVEYDPIMGYKPPASKTLREDNNHRMYVSGCVEVEVKSTEDAYELLAKGQKRRRVAHTALNSESSRSHSVLNIRVVQAPLDPDGVEVLQDKDKVCSSQLALVDLAGSERANRTGNHGDRLREAGNINNCLMTLRTCIEVLRENQLSGGNKLVPYRDDRMTHLFKNFFDGDGKVRMVVCVNPKAEEYDETVNVMKFAEMAREVQVTRSQKVQFDIGLMHGRRRLREQFREEQEKARDQALAAPITPPLLYSFAAFPSMELSSPEDAHILPHLARYLQDRMQQRQTLLSDYRVKDAAFRLRLVEMEKEHSTFQDRNIELEKVLQDRESEVAALEKKIRSLEKANESLLRKNNSIERKKTSLEREIGEREWQIQMASTEKQRIQQDSRNKMAWMEKNFNKKIEEAKRKLADEASTQIHSHKQRLAKVRKILDSDTESIISNGTPLTRSGTRYGMSRITPAKSEPDLTMADKPTPSARPAHSRAMTQAAGSGCKTGRNITKAAVPPPTKPKPNMKYHRRSKSSHEVWLDHNPTGAVDTGSVMTPNIRTRRSVTKLDARDTKGVDKYLLTHMDVDSEGEVATKLFKGDVLHTSGGGKAVVFNDVEVLKHKSPGDKKRKSGERPEDYEGEWSDPEERCRIAIEGHGYRKRTKTSQV